MLIVWSPVLLACPVTEPEEIQPRKVTPAQVSGTAETAVQIQGQGFEPCVKADYDDQQRSEVSFAFLVRAGAHELQQVAWRSSALLTATVPAGLSPGRYTIQVIGPCGRQGSLTDGLEVLGGAGDGGPDGAPADGLPDGPGADLVGADSLPDKNSAAGDS